MIAEHFLQQNRGFLVGVPQFLQGCTGLVPVIRGRVGRFAASRNLFQLPNLLMQVVDLGNSDLDGERLFCVEPGQILVLLIHPWYIIMSEFTEREENP